MGRIAIFGATSGIAKAIAQELLNRGKDLVLIGRKQDPLERLAAQLQCKSEQQCSLFLWDILARDSHPSRFAELSQKWDLDGLYFAPGILMKEDVLEQDPVKTRLLFDVNLTETVVVLNLFAGYFRSKKGGFLSVLSSVAGDRGRKKIKTYSASKAGLSTYLEGLRSSLHPHGVLVQTVKPGPVNTPMVGNYQGPSFLLADPKSVAATIVKAVGRRKAVVYTPGYWRLVMAMMRSLPEALMRKIPA